MIKEHIYRGITWIDLENPSEKEIGNIMERFDIARDAAEDLLSPTPKQRVMMYDTCVYLVLHFPTLSFHKSAFRGNDHRKEIDVIVGKNFLVTVHYHPLTSLDKFSKTIKKQPDDLIEVDASAFFHKLIKNLYHYLLHDIEVIKESLREAETSIFNGEEKRMVFELSKIHRDILRFNTALMPHRDAIESLKAIFKGFFGDSSEALIKDIRSEYERVDRRMSANKAILDELRHTNDSLLSAKQNEAIKGLTMMAFMTFPLSLVASTFAIHANGTPILNRPDAFWVIITIMITIVIGCVIFFGHKKWL